MKLRTLRTTAAALAALIFLIAVAGCATQQADKQQTTAAEETVKSEKVEKTAPETTETTRTAEIEKEDETTNDGHRSDSGSTDSNRDNADSGVDDDSSSAVEKVSIEELAEIIVNQGINGDERIAYLGDRYAEVQAYIDEHYKVEIPTYIYEEEVYAYQPDTGVYYSEGALTPDMGVNYYNGVMETYYNLDMSGVVDWMHSLGYEGDYWVRSDGVKMFGDYVMVASDYGYEPKGTITETSLGLGIVCDTGAGGWYWHDIAVDW